VSTTPISALKALQLIASSNPPFASTNTLLFFFFSFVSRLLLLLFSELPNRMSTDLMKCKAASCKKRNDGGKKERDMRDWSM
jgi:hypothetical protein